MAQYELNVIDYWLILKKRKYLIVLSTALVVLFTFVFSEFLKPTPLYEAVARVKFERNATMAQQLLESMSNAYTNDVATQTEFIRSFPVMERVAVDLGRVAPNVTEEEKRSATYLNIVYNLGQEITTQREGDTNIIRISASSDQPEQAERMANLTATAYRVENIATRNRLVTESRRFVEEQLANLEQRLNDSEDELRTSRSERVRSFSPTRRGLRWRPSRDSKNNIMKCCGSAPKVSVKSTHSSDQTPSSGIRPDGFSPKNRMRS